MNAEKDTREAIKKIAKTFKLSTTSILMILVLLLSFTTVNFRRWIDSNQGFKLLVTSIESLLKIVYSRQVFITLISLIIIALIAEFLTSKFNKGSKESKTESGFTEQKGFFVLFINLKDLFIHLYVEWGVYYLLFLLLITDRKVTVYNYLTDNGQQSIDLVIFVITIINIIFLLMDVKNGFWSINFKFDPSNKKDIVDLGKKSVDGIYLTISEIKLQNDNQEYRLVKDQYYLPKVDKFAHKYYIVLLKNDSNYVQVVNASNNLDELRLNFESIIEECKN